MSADSAETVAALDHFAVEVLSHGKRANALFVAAEADSRAPLAQAYAGALHLFLQTREGVRDALPWLQRARNACQLFGCTEREAFLVCALERWARGSVIEAAALHIEVAERWPSDLLNIKLAQMHQINLGDRPGMARLSQITMAQHTDAAFAWGMFAFAQEQVGDLGAAERSAKRALRLHNDDPWAQHAVAHVFEARGAISECINWMHAIAPQWDRCSSFMYTHNWWHLALMHLDNDEHEMSLDIYDRHVWAVRKTYVQDQINAVSLLSRLECRGVDVGGRWLDIANFVGPRIHDRQNGFIDLHFGYALARAGRDAAVAEWLEGVAAYGIETASMADQVWSRVVLPAAQGMVAHAHGDMAAAARTLETIAPHLSRLGGSTAQQDWFEQIRLQALISAQGFQKARAILDRRTRARPSINWQHRALAKLPMPDNGSIESDRREQATA